MTTKIKGESVRAKLKSLSSKIKVKYSHLETVFLIERLVARLIADKKLSQNLVFKGGFVGLKVYQSPRYTIDLDALLVKSDIGQTLDLVRQQAQTDYGDGAWFRFESQMDLFVVVFLHIHPFQDGNGRLSRALTTMLLLQLGYGHVSYSSFERVIEEKRMHIIGPYAEDRRSSKRSTPRSQQNLKLSLAA